MSYDVYLEVDSGGEPVEAYWRNHTSNTSGMWRAAGVDIANWHGRQASDMAVDLAVAISAIEADREAYVEFEPDNRWGTIDSTLQFLRDLLDACQRFPRSTVRVSR